MSNMASNFLSMSTFARFAMMAVAFQVRILYLLSKRFMKGSMCGYSFSWYSSLRPINNFAQLYLTAAFGEETLSITIGSMLKSCLTL